jgi:Lon protease-like protein
MATAPNPIFENTAGRLLTDSAGFLRLQWSGQARTLADTQALLLHMSQALAQYHWHRVLASQVEMAPFSADEQAWVRNEWLTLAVASGYRTCAILVATDTFARLATAYITTNVQGLPMRYRSFDLEPEAVAWLLQQTP